MGLVVLLSFSGLQIVPANAAVCIRDHDVPGAGPEGKPLSGKRVVVAGVWRGEEQERFFETLHLFEEDTGAEVRYDSVGHDIGATIGQRIEADCAPDVVMLPQPGLLKELAQRRHIQPVEDVVGDLVDANYSSAWRELATVKDTASLYGVWYKAANKSLVWFNAPLFEELDITPPRTWQELKDAASDIVTRSGGAVSPFSLGVLSDSGWVATDIFENIYLQTAGEKLYRQLTDHQISWTDPSVKAALTIMAEVFSRPEWLAGGAEGALTTSFADSVGRVFTEAPRAAMVYEADYVANYVTPRTSVGSVAQAFDFPAISESPPPVLAGGDVAALVSKTPTAEALLRFLATPEAAEPWARMGGFASPNKSVSLAGGGPAAVYPNESVRRSAEALVTAQDVYFDLSDLQHPGFGAATDRGMWQILRDFVREPDVDATAQRLEEAWASTARAPAEPEKVRDWALWRTALQWALAAGIIGLLASALNAPFSRFVLRSHKGAAAASH